MSKERLNLIAAHINNSRYLLVKDNPHFLQELTTITNSPRCIKYYRDIIDNTPINLANTQNSYIMWIFDKVDTVDTTKPTNIVQGRYSMPDVDMDFEVRGRGEIIDYIKNRFGRDKVAQMITFTRMQGRTALKDVLRVNNACSFDEMNSITSFIPDEAEISDQLQEMKEEEGESSIIKWALENHSEDLAEWCYLDDEGRCQGDLARYFEQAIRLEGIPRSQGKHAAGVIISQEPLNEVCPMLYDNSTGEPICGLEMHSLESIGMVKMDILGVAALDKIHIAQDLINATFKA